MTSPTLRASAAIVVLVALLALSAQPVAALQTNTSLGSSHTNDTELGNAAQLSNVTVEGSGESASVVLNTTLFDDSFESEAADSGTPDNWEVVSTGFSVQEVTTSNSIDGAQAAHFNETTDFSASSVRPAEQPYGSPTTNNISGWMYFGEAIGGSGADLARFGLREGGTERIQVGIRNGDLQYHNGSSWVTLSTAVDAKEWVKVTVYDIDPGADTFAVQWDIDGGGSGSSTGLSMSSAMSSGYDDTLFVVDGEAFLDGFSIAKTGDTGTYISATHSVDNAQTGFSNLTLANASAEVTWQEHDGSSWNDIASNTFTATGNHTIDISAATNSDLRVNVTFTETGDNPTAELHDEGVLFTNHEPEIDNSSASPTGSLTQSTQTLSINVSDTEFGTAQSDTLTAEFFVDGSSVGSDTLNSNGTAQVSHSFTGGDHTWHAVVSDSYGLSNTSQTFSVSTPSNVTIREETEPHDIVNTATITVVVSGSGETVDRQTVTDGNVSLDGLPTDEEYVVLVNATGYHQRAILVQDIFEQSSVFVLNESEPSVENTFIIEDRSGAFPPSETKLLIQKPVNQSLYDSGASTEYQWLTIGGDRLGADQSLTVALHENGRYRLVAQNEEGDERILGEYTAVDAGAVPLRVGNVVVTPDDSSTYGWDANFTNVSGTKYVKFQFNDPDTDTTDLRLIIHEFGNESNEIENSTHAGPYGTFSFTEDLSAIGPDAENTTWVVKFEATRGGEAISGSKVVGRETIGKGFPVAPMWLHVGSVGFLILLAGLVGGLVNPGAGAATISATGGIFWHVGFLPPEIGGGAIALGLLLSAAWIVAVEGGGIR